MNIGFLVDGEVAILQLAGRFTSGSDAEYLRAKESLRESGKRKVMVDCSEVAYLDSTALNFLVRLYTTTINADGRFALCGLNRRMTEVLRITHLDQIIPIYEGRAGALLALRQAEERSERAGEG